MSAPTTKETNEFGILMDALDNYFHVMSCPNHTREERDEAFKEARGAYVMFAYDGDAEQLVGTDPPPDAGGGPAPNAPSTPRLQ